MRPNSVFGLPLKITGDREYELTEAYAVPLAPPIRIKGRADLSVVTIEAGFRWAKGAGPFKFTVRDQADAIFVMLHDKLYTLLRGTRHGLWKADTAAYQKMVEMNVPRRFRWPRMVAIRAWGIIREPFDLWRVQRQLKNAPTPRRKPRR